MDAPADRARARALSLACWSGPVRVEPVAGGITNANFVVHDGDERFFVRIGEDVAVHGVWRWNELAASRAAHAAGVSPPVVHAEPGAMVLRFIEGRTLCAEDLHDLTTLRNAITLVKRCHQHVSRHLRGPSVLFWVFQVIRNYAETLRADGSAHVAQLSRLEAIAARLESEVGAVHLCFAHNDLLAANFVDDGERLWLVDWDYGGFNSPLFDLGGLASNNGLSEEKERWMLEAYFEARLGAELWRRYSAMKCASLLRETLWSMVSEIHSSVAFDYVAYTAANLDAFEQAHARHAAAGGAA